MHNIAPAEQLKIKEYLQAGSKIAAIKHYREVAGCDLTDAVTRIDTYIKQERLIHPQAFQKLDNDSGSGFESGAKKGKRKFAFLIMFLVSLPIVVASFDWQQITGFKSFNAFKYYMLDQKEVQDLKQFLAQYIDFDETYSASKTQYQASEKREQKEQRAKEKQRRAKQRQAKKQKKIAQALKKKQSLTASQVLEKASRPHKEANKPYPSQAMPSTKLSPLQQLYQTKLANYDYQDWKSMEGLPKGYQDFPEEIQIKVLRTQYAAKQTLPANQSVQSIPLLNELMLSQLELSQQKPEIDGRITKQEWQHSLKLNTQPYIHETRIYLQADEKWLYIAADVPKERTKKGFDQLRFYYHVNLLPEIKNERVHISGHSGTGRQLRGIRQTTIRWYGEPAANHEERWKKYPINDWRIYKHAWGASSLETYRQYEAKILLSEAGIHLGVPFAAYAIIETDPLRKADGKFKKRQYLGKLGSQKKPSWFIIR